MSAFLVQHETIRKVCSAFAFERGYTWPELDKLGRELLLMNHRALLARYGDAMPESVRFTFYPDWKLRAELLAECECLLYQCSEGDVPDCELYRKLESVIESFSDVSQDSEEYENAAWD